MTSEEPRSRPAPWPRRCGYCEALIEPADAPHWHHGRVSRCHLRQETRRA